MQLGLIVAMAENQVIGKGGDLPWHLPEDLKHFQTMTLGTVMIMGRRTFESLGKPLPKRKNWVVSRTLDPVPGVKVRPSLSNVLEELRGRSDVDVVYVIGGSKLYEEALSVVDFMDITHVDAEFEGDTYFPQVPWERFEVESERVLEREGEPRQRFVRYRRRKS